MNDRKALTPSSSKSSSRLPTMELFKKRLHVGTPGNHSERHLIKRVPLTPTSQREKSVDAVITPEIASIVVRQYLLPMFELETTPKQNNNGSSSISDELHRPLEAISGTVYGELKLADSLMKELTDVREEIERVAQELKFAEQERQSVSAELEHSKRNYAKVTEDISLMSSQFQDSLKLQQHSDLKMAFSNSQLYEYRKMYLQCEDENKTLKSALHEEKALNDKRKNTATELEYGNELLNMENEIMTKRLGGLYQELDKLPSRKYVEGKIWEELEILLKSLKNLTEFCNDISSNLTNSMNKRDELKGQFQEIEQLTEEIKMQRDKLASATKEHIGKLDKELTETNDAKEEFKSKLSKLEKNYKDLTESYDKMRQKLKQWKQRGKQYGEHEEKSCIKCRKAFTDSENYNWSCKVHTGAYNGENYWCCGKKGKEAPGCQSSKHVAKEEEEELNRDKDDDKLKYASAKCSSCKQLGHEAHECPKDPNVQGSDPEEDIKRIEEIKKKKKANAANVVVNQKLMSIMALRFQDRGFGLNDVSSGSDIEEENEEAIDYVHEPFKDIKLLQNMSFHHSDNIIPIEKFTIIEEKNKEKGKGKLWQQTSLLQSESETNK